MTSLKRKAYFGVGWMSILRLATQAIVIFKLALIARILSPEDFGIFALVTVTVTALESLSETGFSYAAIHMDTKVNKIAKSILIVSFVRGLLLCIFTIIIAKPVSMFFHQDIFYLLLTASLVPLLRGLINPNIIQFQKDLIFGKVFVLQLIPAVANTILTIILVLSINSVWALLYGLLLSTLVELLLSYLMVKFDFKNPIEKSHIKKLFKYGKWMTVGGISTYLSTQIDNIVIGRLLGPQALGLYDFSYRTSNIAFTQVTDTVSQVAFPLYAKRKNDLSHVKNIYKKNVFVVSSIALLITLPFIFFPGQILLFLFGEQWVGAATVLRILSVYGFLRATVGPAGPLLLALGKPDTLTKLNTANLVFVAVLLIPGVYLYGLEGAAYAMLISYILTVPFYFVSVKKTLKL